jgi:hypothetical protein
VVAAALFLGRFDRRFYLGIGWAGLLAVFAARFQPETPYEQIGSAVDLYIGTQKLALALLLLAMAESAVSALRGRPGAERLPTNWERLTTSWAFLYGPYLIINGVIAALWSFGLSRSATTAFAGWSCAMECSFSQWKYDLARFELLNAAVVLLAGLAALVLALAYSVAAWWQYRGSARFAQGGVAALSLLIPTAFLSVSLGLLIPNDHLSNLLSWPGLKTLLSSLLSPRSLDFLGFSLSFTAAAFVLLAGMEAYRVLVAREAARAEADSAYRGSALQSASRSTALAGLLAVVVGPLVAWVAGLAVRPAGAWLVRHVGEVAQEADPSMLVIYAASATRLLPYLFLVVGPMSQVFKVVGDLIFYLAPAAPEDLTPPASDRSFRREVGSRVGALLDHLKTERVRTVRLLAHSQGTVIASEVVLERLKLGQQDVCYDLELLGSPIGSLYRRFLGLSILPSKLPEGMKVTNVYHHDDYIAGRIGPPGVVNDAPGVIKDLACGFGGHRDYWPQVDLSIGH